jgi:hypothetical protein
VGGQPSEALGGVELEHGQVQRRAVEIAAQDHRVRPQLLCDVGDHPVVGGGRAGEDRHVAEPGQDVADAAVVGPEVVAPVGDAVRLVDDQEPDLGGELRQHLVAKARGVEPLGRDDEDVDRSRGDAGVDLVPVVGVRRVDGLGRDAGPPGGCDLVAHQGQ